MCPQKKPILQIVLHNSADSEQVRNLFAEEDYFVETATGFSTDVARHHARQTDLFITDFETLRRRKEFFAAGKNNQTTARVPVLVLGNGAEKENLHEIFQAGADDFVADRRDQPQILARTAKLIERKRANELLTESEHYFRSLVENVSDIITILSFDGTIIFESASIARILGHNPAELVGKNAFEFVHPDDRERVFQYFYEFSRVHGVASSPIEFRFRDSRDEWRILEAIGKIADHPTLGYIAVVNSRDVTERRKSEDARRASEENFRMVLDNSLDIIYQINLKTRTFDYVSRAAKVVTGYDQKDFVRGGFDFTHSLVHPDDLAAVKKSYGQALANIAGGIREHSIEYRLQTKHRGWRWVRENRAIVTDAANQPVAIISTARDITDQKDFEAYLHLQKTLLESLTEASMDGILALSETERTISYNRRFLEMWEIGEADVKEKSKDEVIAAFAGKLKFPQAFESEVERLSHNPYESKSHEIRLRDGRYFESYTAPIKDGENRFFGRVWFIRDITERKKTERALIESEDNYRDIVENSQELICTHDLQGNILSCNKMFEQITGFSRTQLGEMNIADILIPERRAELQKYLDEISSRGVAHGLMAVRKRDGEKRIWEYHNSLRTEGVAEPLVRAMAMDITERKRAEDYLRESEARFRNLADTAPVWIWIAGTDSKLTYSNKTFLDFTGNTLEGEIAEGWKQIHPDDLAHAREIYWKAFKKREGYSLEYRHRRHDGEYRWVLLIGVPRWTPSGSFIGYIGSGIDIHERKQAEEILHQTEEKLRQAQKLESVGRLAGGIAHDFNNMLTAIIGYSEISLKKLDAAHPVKRNLEEIKKAAERSASLTSQLLAFSRQQVLQPKIIAFNDLVSDTLKMLQRLIGENIYLSVNLDPKVETIKADPGQLTQVIVNLAVNARDAMPDGGVLSISTEKIAYSERLPLSNDSEIAENYVLLTVKDNGTGIAPEHLLHIFEPFYTTKEIGKGTGLGLATVYGIVKQSSGEIVAESEIGVGTTFKIYFPCVEKEKSREAEISEAETFTKGSETLLIIEDEPMVRELTQKILEEEGYRIIAAENGKNALEIVKKMDGKIDLVITDVVMPEMSGIEFSQQIKETYPHLPILFTSGYSDDKTFFEELRDPNTMFLGKPYVTATLVGKVREFLDARR